MSSTTRQQIVEQLMAEELSARDLSQILSIMEKEVYAHLEHVAKSVQGSGRKLIVSPPRCKDCGFVFTDRQRFTKPGKCPKCRGSHIRPPYFSIR